MANNHSEMSYEEAREKYNGYMLLCASERAKRLGGQYGSQITDLKVFLDTRTEWLKAPASTKYHMSIEGGLLIHSIGVVENALKISKALMPEIPIDSIILCGIMHDAGKIYSQARPDGTIVGRYEPNILKSTGKVSEVQPFAYTKGGNEISLTIKDLLIPLKFVDMSDAEMIAIMNADGQYVEVNKSLQHNEPPLACIIHWADYWQGHIIEGNIQADWLSNIFRR